GASYIVDFNGRTGAEAEADRTRRRAPAENGSSDAAALAEAVLRGDLRIEAIEDRSHVVNVQDYVAQVGQGAIAPRDDDRLGRSDVGVILLRNLWARELRARAEGP